jgi:hypothetical protein
MVNFKNWANKAKQPDIPARVTEFRMEDHEYWTNKGKKTESRREISIEDLEIWGKKRYCKTKNNNLECEICDYDCNKICKMKKHRNTKHGSIRF